MYHSIYQIFYEDTPKEDWRFIENPLLLPVAESVALADSRSQTIQRFGIWLESEQLGTFSLPFFTLSPTAKEHYLAKRYEPFQKTAAALLALSREQFIREYDTVDNLISQLKQHFCDFSDCYIMEEHEAPVPFDWFLRTAPADTPFYFGAVFDYRT